MVKTLKTYYSFLLRYKVLFISFIFALTINASLSSVQPFFLKIFIDKIPTASFSAIVGVFIIYIVIRIITVITDVLAGRFGDRMLGPASRDMRLKYFQKINDLDFAYHLSKKTGSLISAVKRGDNAFFELHFVLHWRIGSIFINFLVMSIFFFRLNVWLLLAIVLTFGLNLLSSRKLLKKNFKARKVFVDSDDQAMDIITDNLLNYETVKLFAKEKWEHNRLYNFHDSWIKKFFTFADTFRDIDISVGILGNLGIMLTLILGLIQFRANIITVGDYIMIIGFIITFYPHLFELIYESRRLVQATIDIEKYFKILDEPILVPDPINSTNIKNIAGEIEFKNVTFYYPETNKPALENFSLLIRPGQSIALVGESGVGKTTISKLLLRFYDVSKGEILLDGINIKKFKKSKLRSYMGVVPQEPALFNNTIAYNIAYGCNKATKKEIVAAAQMANLDDFINTLPKKYETLVGERGVKLSGGQKQRLAIARMILANPDIVIFDEATSQLDSESERKIQSAFWKAVKNKTTIIIAHRLSTVINAEKIVVLDKGKISEIGPHHELIKKPNSTYFHFWQLQTQSQVL
jgi:ATP-binding cassette, subfamily B, heavy metal transporter